MSSFLPDQPHLGASGAPARSFAPELSPWGDIPRAERRAWFRVLFDYPPTWPGVLFMAHGRSVGDGDDPKAPHGWAEHAAVFHAIGFTPAEWYLLRQTASMLRDVLQQRGVVDRVLRPVGPRSASSLGSLSALLPEVGPSWLARVRSGMSPRAALLEGASPGHANGARRRATRTTPDDDAEATCGFIGPDDEGQGTDLHDADA